MKGDYFKSVVVGNGGVGKTSFLITYFTGSFPPYITTVAENTVVETNGINMVFWDTGGGEDYPRLRPLSYPSTDVFILCFSLDDIQSFEELYSLWYPEITRFCPNTPILLVGTKLDLRENGGNNLNCVITTEEGQKMAANIGAVEYLECSSLFQKGVKDVIDAVVSICKKNDKFRKKRK